MYDFDYTTRIQGCLSFMQREAGSIDSKSCHFILQFQKCDEIIVLHLGYLNYTQYRVKVSFKGLENIAYDIHVKFVVSSSHWWHGFLEQIVSCFFHLI